MGKDNYKKIYQSSIENPESFWLEQAKSLPWYRLPEKALSQDSNGFHRWFKGASMNTCYFAIDQHCENGRGEQIALIYDSPVTGHIQKVTYNALKEEVGKLAGALQNLGIEKGDRVVIYMPMIPQAAYAMLACARIGAIHSVVFGGFAPHELAIRIDDAEPKAIITASCGIEFDKIIPYKPLINQAVEEANYKPEHVIVFQREVQKAVLDRSIDKDYAEIVKDAPIAECVPVDATDPLYILYTSGTTGKPKGIVRDNGGHAVALKWSLENIYNIEAGDVFWAASDVGWVVGHSYIVYAPLISGCTTILFEGKPIRTPDAGVFWRVIEQHQVNVLFTAPTAIRAIRKEDHEGVHIKKYDLSSLRILFLAGERCNPATYHWAKEQLNIPVIDHWWQTESGWPMVANPMGIHQFEVKPGSSSVPVPGYDIQILDEDGNALETNKEGFVTVKLPMPPGCLPTLWRDDARFKSSYLEQFDGYYLTGDGGYKDEDGYVYIMGRIDDVINVSGHRLSTGEMEEIVVAHPHITECAVIGIADNLRGQRPIALVVIKDFSGITEQEVELELIELIREKIGAVAYMKTAIEVKRLPKTRSGKILRKIMRKMADGEEYTIPSTIDDPEILNEIKEALMRREVGKAFGQLEEEL